MRARFLLTLLLLCEAASLRADDPRPRPVMRDFMGLNVQSEEFKPELYTPVTRLLRFHHPVKRDIIADPAAPMQQLYRSWKSAGCRMHASLMFDDIAPGALKDMPRDAEAYGRAFAKAFGPSSKDALIEAVEIGCEAGKHDDATYWKLFESMARGLRAGDPALRIAACAVKPSLDGLAGLDALWDMLNIGCYAEVEGSPTRRRSHPEDPSTHFIENVGRALKWRELHAPKKEFWVTEFGYDASTKIPPSTGESARWQGCTEEQQAAWSVRSFLLLARLGVERAYLHCSNDKDEPRVNGSSGITRNFEPKPAFHALAWLHRSLGEYRFFRADREEDECYAYEFVHGTQPNRHAWVVWRAAGEPRTVRLFNDPQRVLRAERMPLVAGDAEKVEAKQENEGYVAVQASERPVIIWMEKP